MARIHRKLFPALTTKNQTQDCPDFCDPACPYNCYSFPDYYYFPPPPPPPPPISAAEHSSLGTHIPSYFIILASLFAVIFVVLGFYVIKAKCYSDWCGWRGNGPAPSQLDSSEEEFLDENQVDHPIWFITTNGLQQSIINSITVCKYRKGEGLIEGTECSVCLNEFQENETLRLLPKCNHAFHIPCIDTWLSSHTNCPLCRAGIVSNSVRPEVSVSNMGSTELNSNNLGINQETQTENSQNEGELSNNMAVVGTGVSANRAGTGEAQDSTDESITKEHPNVERNQVVQVISNLDEHHQFLNDNIQNGIRSMSMDSRLASSSCRGPGCITEPESHSLCPTEDNPEPQAAMFEGSRRSSIAKCLHISPVSMKRSFSCNGRILSTRGCRSLDTSLPY